MVDIIHATHRTYSQLSIKLTNIKNNINRNTVCSIAYLYDIDKLSTDCYTINDKLTKCNNTDLIIYKDRFRELYRECIRLRALINPRSIQKLIEPLCSS